MRITLKIAAVALLLVFVPQPCLAMMGIETVSAERAKELGMEVRSHATGPDAVRVELEFAAAGELKRFVRVDLDVRDGEKLLFSSTLKEDASAKAGHVVVSFTADRAHLDQITLTVVAGVPMDLNVYQLRVKDFVEAKAAD